MKHGVQTSPERPLPASAIAPRLRALDCPVHILPLVYFRVLFGVIMAVEAWRYLSQDWIKAKYLQPMFHFTYYGLDWVQPWPGQGMYFHFIALGVLACCIAAGFAYRLSASLFFLGFTYVFLLEQALYLNHFYLICLLSFLLVFLPAHRARSVDALLRPRLYSETAPAWTLWLLRAQIGVVYFYGGLAKLNGDWLRGEPMRMWLAQRTDFPIMGGWFTSEWTVAFFAYGGLLLDLLIVPLLLWPRTTWLGCLAAVLFHALNARLFSIGVFPWLMLAATPLFLPQSWWIRTFRLEYPALTADRRPSTRSPLVTALLGSYLLVQLLVPLRHHLYPGNVSWTEQGHRFSWHMKLRTKQGKGQFQVLDPAGGHTWSVDPFDHLEPWQAQRMLTQPEMILQFSHLLADHYSRLGHPEVEVRAKVLASLNGRRPQPLVNPETNLAAQRRNLWPAEWILPLEEPLRVRSQTGRKD